MNGGEITEDRARAQNAAGLLGVCYQNRLNPTSQRIRRGAGRGGDGQDAEYQSRAPWSRSGAYYTESPWRGRFATEGGSLLINQAIHTLDLMGSGLRAA